jgi:hypothetical protein
MKKLLLTGLAAFIFYSSPAGIYRHDVDKKKYTEAGNSAEFDCVGEIIPKEKDGSASCVLISDKYVLTAAHVIIQTKTKAVDKEMNGMKVTIYEPVENRVGRPDEFIFRFKGKKYKAKRIIIHPNYMNEATKGNCDIAIVELETRVEGVKPIPLYRSDDLLHKQVTGVGFGVSGPANKPEDVSPRHDKIAGENTVDSIGGFVYDGSPTLLFADFDHPTNKDCNVMGSAQPCANEYIIGGGDSGGGLFCKVDGEWRLAGINTGSYTDMHVLLSTGYYGQTMSWTSIVPFIKWIKENRYEVER